MGPGATADNPGMVPVAPIAPRTTAWFRESRPLVRRVLLYATAGPFATLVLAAVFRSIDIWGLLLLVAFQAAVAVGLFAIIRPASYAGSLWRALTGASWLASAIALLRMAGPHHDAYALWTLMWLAPGFATCLVAAVVSALPSRSREPGTRSWFYGRMAIVVAAVGILALMVPVGWVVIGALNQVATGLAGDAPSPDRFDPLMRRDLTEYFATPDSTPVTVAYDLLRHGPTQVGIGYPKYYVWVRVHSADTTLQGAVRIAAIDPEHLQVFQFLTSDEILADPARVRQTFPLALNQELMRRAREASR